MLFKCSPSEKELELIRQKQRQADYDRRTWHKWFAWKPVSLTDGSGRCVWLEFVQRKEVLHESPYEDWTTWEYYRGNRDYRGKS
jgi:hypothetical protein